jgi:hypothetical protein
MLQTFIDDVELVVGSSDDQHEITKRVAQRLSALLAGGYRRPPEFVRPSPGTPRDVPALHRSRRPLVPGVRGLERGSTHARARNS